MRTHMHDGQVQHPTGQCCGQHRLMCIGAPAAQRVLPCTAERLPDPLWAAMRCRMSLCRCTCGCCCCRLSAYQVEVLTLCALQMPYYVPKACAKLVRICTGHDKKREACQHVTARSHT